MTGPFLIVLSLFSQILWAASTPKPIVYDVRNLAQAGASLHVCFESERYQKLDAAKSNQFHQLDSRLTALVNKIATFFNDGSLLLYYEFLRDRKTADPVMIEFVRNEYKFCDDNLIEKITIYVTEREHYITSVLKSGKRPSTMQRQVMPERKRSKSKFISQCTSLFISEKVPANLVRPYCACVADGMAEIDEKLREQSGSQESVSRKQVFAKCQHLLPRKTKTVPGKR